PQEEPAEPRIGFAVPRAAGGAVERNRIKRRLREVWNERLERVPPGHDYVLIVRPGLVEAAGTNGFPWPRGPLARAPPTTTVIASTSCSSRPGCWWHERRDAFPGDARNRPHLVLPGDARRAVPDHLQVPPVLLRVRGAGD